MDISLDDRSLQRAVQGRTAAELQRLKEGDNLRVLAPAGQMPAARALIRQPDVKPRSAPLKALPPLKAAEGQEVKPVLIPLNAVTASKSVSKANDNWLSASMANVSIGNDEQKPAGEESASFCP